MTRGIVQVSFLDKHGDGAKERIVADSNGS
jgi:hypothetical protein